MVKGRSEHEEQVCLMRWWALSHGVYGVPESLLFAIPNGGKRHISVAQKLKAEGVRAGVPDLFLAVPKGNRPGLFIELKTTKLGRAIEAQKRILSELETRGYKAVLCRGWIEAKETIEAYLNERNVR